MKKYIFFVFFILSNFLFAQIFEIKSINEISNLQKYNLIIFDLDNTIIEPVQTLGSEQWFFNAIKKKEAEGTDKKKAFETTLSQWYEIQSVTQVKLVEEEIKNLIKNLQNKKVKIICLTSRKSDFAYTTLKQLNSLNINFYKTAPYKKNLYLESGAVYKKGVLFCEGKNKGHILKNFFYKIGYFPRSIVFIDDKQKYLLEIDKFCKSKRIKYIGYRYGYLDEKVKNFNDEICDIQFKFFKNILSDNEAKEMLNKK